MWGKVIATNIGSKKISDWHFKIFDDFSSYNLWDLRYLTCYNKRPMTDWLQTFGNSGENVIIAIYYENKWASLMISDRRINYAWPPVPGSEYLTKTGHREVAVAHPTVNLEDRGGQLLEVEVNHKRTMVTMSRYYIWQCGIF